MYFSFPYKSICFIAIILFFSLRTYSQSAFIVESFDLIYKNNNDTILGIDNNSIFIIPTEDTMLIWMTNHGDMFNFIDSTLEFNNSYLLIPVNQTNLIFKDGTLVNIYIETIDIKMYFK